MKNKNSAECFKKNSSSLVVLTSNYYLVKENLLNDYINNQALTECYDIVFSAIKMFIFFFKMELIICLFASFHVFIIAYKKASVVKHKISYQATFAM